MVRQMREVSQGAHWDATTLISLPSIPIRDSLEWNDRVHVASRAHGAAFKQRLLVLYALVIDIEAGLHIVKRVANTVLANPEVVIERVLSLWADEHLEGLDIHARVHHLGHLAGGHALWVTDVVFPEEELAREVRHLDPVSICNREHAALPAADAVQGEVLHELTAQRAAAHHKVLELLKLLAEGMSVDGSQRVIPAANWIAVHGLLAWKGLHGVEVKPTRDGRELACNLDHLLCHDATQEGAERLNRGAEVPHELGNEFVIHIYLKSRHFRGHELLCFSSYCGSLPVADRQRSSALRFQGQRSMEQKVHLQLRAEVDHISSNHIVEGHARVLHSFSQGSEGIGHPDLLLRHETAGDIRREAARVPNADGVDRIVGLGCNLPCRDGVATGSWLLVRHDTVAALHVGELQVAALGQRSWRLAVGHGQPHEGIGALLDALDEAKHRSLAIAVTHHVRRSQVHEDAAEDTAGVDVDEPDWLWRSSAAKLVPLQEVWERHALTHQHDGVLLDNLRANSIH
mmetsp:Transcript_46328/g.83489  ORF Transcript_46328/g.83489 Transcript_46328/m.83489 type:complete len:516 (-) Transcript_46328:459-2006(-)